MTNSKTFLAQKIEDQAASFLMQISVQGNPLTDVPAGLGL